MIAAIVEAILGLFAAIIEWIAGVLSLAPRRSVPAKSLLSCCCFSSARAGGVLLGVRASVGDVVVSQAAARSQAGSAPRQTQGEAPE